MLLKYLFIIVLQKYLNMYYYSNTYTQVLDNTGNDPCHFNFEMWFLFPWCGPKCVWT